MARKRMIDPRIWDSEQVMRLNPVAFKVYVYTISAADDHGKLPVCFEMLASRVFPFNGVNVEQVRDAVIEMDKIGLIILYVVDGKDFIKHPNWTKYQKIDHPSESSVPDPANDTGAIPERSRKRRYSSRKLRCNGIEENRIEVKGIEIEPPAAVAAIVNTDPLYHRIEQGFLKHNGERFTDYAKEGAAIHGLIKKARARDAYHAEDLLVSVCAAFWKLKQSDTSARGFWRSQPFTPSALNSGAIWDRVLESMRREEVDPAVAELITGAAK